MQKFKRKIGRAARDGPQTINGWVRGPWVRIKLEKNRVSALKKGKSKSETGSQKKMSTSHVDPRK